MRDINTKNRLLELDALRGIAALAVVLYHYTQRFSELYPDLQSEGIRFLYGNLGVQLFFLLSGFVIFLTLKTTSSPVDFIKRRAVRLYPSYIMCVILTYLCVVAFGLEGREVTFKEAILNLTLIEGFIPGINYVDGAYWSLTVEITFYLIVTIIIYFKMIKHIFKVLLLWIIASFLMFYLTKTYDSNIIETLYSKTISNYSYLFISGISFYFLLEKLYKRYLLLILLSLVFQYISSGIDVFLIVLGIYGVFWLTINQKLKFLSNKVLVFLGSISYSLYLIHQNIGYIIIIYLKKAGLDSSIWIVIPIVVSIGIAFFITKYIENPIINLMKVKFFHKKISKAS